MVARGATPLSKHAAASPLADELLPSRHAAQSLLHPGLRVPAISISFLQPHPRQLGVFKLFNALARGKAYEADQLFATLDTTTRRIWIPPANPVVLSDTVGFIRDLPHGLVAAFRATLEETVRADLLLHVVDAASPARDTQQAEVNKVLAEIGAEEAPQVIVFNKIDAAGLSASVERDQYGRISRVFVSARTGSGLEGLRGAIAEFGKMRGSARAERNPPNASISF